MVEAVAGRVNGAKKARAEALLIGSIYGTTEVVPSLRTAALTLTPRPIRFVIYVGVNPDVPIQNLKAPASEGGRYKSI
jgi:hypothetical protein